MIFGWASCDFDEDDDEVYNLRQKEFLQKCIDKKEEEDKMTVSINWKDSKNKVLYYRDLPYNASFVIDTVESKGAVYRKVKISSNVTSSYNDIDGQMEEATGNVFKPTASPIKLVEVIINIDSAKPSIYK